MRDILDQIKKGLDLNLYYLALFVALSIPDICGAMESENGYGTEEKYIEWFNKYIAPKYCDSFNGQQCYYFRCVLLHQGRSYHPKTGYEKIFFIEPKTTLNKMHCTEAGDSNSTAFIIDINIFCNDIISGVEQWLMVNKNNPIYQKNYNKMIKRYPNGLSPFVGGLVVIG